MKSKAKSDPLQTLALSVGDFIRYWGFRRVHGAIWTQLYLSKTPLSCTDLTRRLRLSKSLISPALVELYRFKLIKETLSPNEKTKLYIATDNINEVIQHVLRDREALMLRRITKNFAAFSEVAEQDDTIDPKRVNSLNEMIISANLMLEIILSQKDIMNLPVELQL